MSPIHFYPNISDLLPQHPCFGKIKKTAQFAAKVFAATVASSVACFLNPSFFVVGLFYGGAAYKLANKNIATFSFIKNGIQKQLGWAGVAALVTVITLNAFFILPIATATYSSCIGTWLGNRAFYFAAGQTPPEFNPFESD